MNINWRRLEMNPAPILIIVLLAFIAAFLVTGGNFGGLFTVVTSDTGGCDPTVTPNLCV